MTTPRREQTLAAFFAAIQTIDGFTTIERNPEWMVDSPTDNEMPAAGVYDGAERVEDQNVRDLFIVTSAQVELWTLKITIAEALKDLNDKLGLVRLTVGANQQLGGLSSRVRYLGCDEPDIVAAKSTPCQASLQMQFEIERFEQHDTPYL